ncbi:MAG: FAD-dependent oxidoreductase [Trebonia sp.]
MGGRLHTVDLGGLPVDLGGSWIHMPDGNPMTVFARLAGVPCESADPVPEIAGFDYGEGRRLPAAEAADLLGCYLEGLPESAEGLLAKLGQDDSMAEAIEAFVASGSRSPDQARRVRQMLYAGIEAESAGLAERQSLRWMWNELEYGGSYFGDTPVRWALGMLAEATGRPCPEPAAVAVTSWAADPWAGGAYTHIPPGASPADADLLGDPVGGRLLFAGEHTQSARLAYADGALTSGIREAKRLLGTPAVRLTVNHASKAAGHVRAGWLPGDRRRRSGRTGQVLVRAARLVTRRAVLHSTRPLAGRAPRSRSTPATRPPSR